jgi:hypothetical protein
MTTFTKEQIKDLGYPFVAEETFRVALRSGNKFKFFTSEVEAFAYCLLTKATGSVWLRVGEAFELDCDTTEGFIKEYAEGFRALVDSQNAGLFDPEFLV